MFWLRVLGVSILVLPAEAAVKFNRDIRPIMSDTCFRCHGPDRSSRMAGLRLDIRDEAIKPRKSGLAPIVPGSPEKSEIIQRIFSTNAAKLMPPKHAHKELTDGQKNLLRQWVQEGAVYEGHWAFQPVAKPGVPQSAAATVRNPIDAFIQDRLQAEGLKPSPEADKRTLLRRVTLDLTGLPPTEHEYASFSSDASADAYEKVVDRLLASPRHAEMQTMRWLDAVRYADSAGFHGDNLWPVWPYRDWVLRAFRENMSFDRFTREQIAGDLLPNATVDQKIASAYNRLNRASAEGGIQPKEYLAKYGADRVRTTATVFLGATMGCAECHDHKFDPFTAKDFYAFKAFFSDIRETGLIPDRGARAWGTKLDLPTAEQKAELDAVELRIADVQAKLSARSKALEEQRWAWEPRLLKDHAAGLLGWRYQVPIAVASARGTQLNVATKELVDYNYYLNGSLASEKKRGDGLILASGPLPDTDTYTVTLKPGAGRWTAVGIDVYQDESLPGNRLGRGWSGFLVSEVELLINDRAVPFSLATSTSFGEAPETGAMGAIDGNPDTAWGVYFGEHRNPFVALRLAEPLDTTPDSVLTLRIRQETLERRALIGRFRVALNSGTYAYPETGESGAKSRARKADPDAPTLGVQVDFGIPIALQAVLKTEEEERAPDQVRMVDEFFQWSHPELSELYTDLKRLEYQRDLIRARVARVLVTERMRPRVTRILPRGNFLDDTGEIVEPAIPAVFGSVKPQGATRLELANWIVAKDNPLTARAQMNRLWRVYFGTGLSRVLEDLGSQGEWPTHPELLDWLAAEFAESWDMRKMTRLIVTSHTYRQGSQSSRTLDEKDPGNRLLARQSRFRVDAEVVHDIALSVAGLLEERFGGPSVRPPQPAGYLAAMNFPKRDYSESQGSDLYRRALYTQWQRTFLHPTLLTFDAPTREECTVNRVNSNTPLQALVLLNDPIFVEASRVFAERIQSEGGAKFDARLQFAFMRALNRAPEAAEKKVLGDLYTRSLMRYQKSKNEVQQLGANSPEHAALTVVARAILNLHETITRN